MMTRKRKRTVTKTINKRAIPLDERPDDEISRARVPFIEHLVLLKWQFRHRAV